MALKRLLVLAGEESGLIYARELRQALDGVEIRGYQDYGFDTADLAVIGFAAVLKRLPFFLRVKRTMERAIDEWRPDAVCTIDYPGLNLKLAAYAKRRNIRAVHVVCPQVWAWRSGRIPKIERDLDALCCFFPFEPSLFKPGFATFVGHPLARPASGCREDRREKGLVALLPGSRLGEIERILPTMLESAAKLGGSCRRLVIPAANDRALSAIGRIVREFGDGVKVEVRSGGARELLSVADCAVVASGTATLEAALARCPTVLVYRVGAIFAFIMRRLIKGTKYIGLANVIWDRAHRREPNGEAKLDAAAAAGYLRSRANPMPELIQEDFTADNVAAIVGNWLDDESARAKAAARLDEAMRLLETAGDPVARIAEVVKG